MENNTAKLEKKKKVLWPIFVAAGVLVVGVVAFVVFMAVRGNGKSGVQKYMKTAEKYMSELDYKAAIAEYKSAIEIDPTNLDAYLGLADAYEALIDDALDDGKTDKAEKYAEKLFEILEEGIGELSDDAAEELQERYDELEEKYEDIITSDYPEEEIDYSEINKYLEMVEEDPYNADAYVALAYAYIDINDFDSALEWAKIGYEKTGDERLKNLIDSLESGNVTDRDGRIKQISYYDGNGKLQYRIRYTYNADGYIYTMTSVKANGKISYVFRNEYDENGRCIKELYSYWSEGYEYRTYEYDSEGNSVTRLYSDKDVFIGSEEYKYENETYYNYRYDADGQLSYYTSSRTVDEISYYYIYNGDGTLRSYEIRYPDGNNYRRDYYDANGELSRYYIEIYDENNMYTGYMSFDVDGNLIEYSESN